MIARRRSLLVSFFSCVCACASAEPPPPAPPGLPNVPVAVLATITDSDARVELARVLSFDGCYDEAIAEYRKAMADRPDDAALRGELGQVLGWANRREEAVSMLSALPVDSLSPSAAVLLADLIVQDDKFDQAAGLYRRALKTAPDDRPTRFKLARALSWAKRHEESLAEFRALLEVEPEDIQVRRHYAQVLGWAGRADEAAVEWRRTLPVSP